MHAIHQPHCQFTVADAPLLPVPSRTPSSQLRELAKGRKRWRGSLSIIRLDNLLTSTFIATEVKSFLMPLLGWGPSTGVKSSRVFGLLFHVDQTCWEEVRAPSLYRSKDDLPVDCGLAVCPPWWDVAGELGNLPPLLSCFAKFVEPAGQDWAELSPPLFTQTTGEQHELSVSNLTLELKTYSRITVKRQTTYILYSWFFR